MTATALGDAHVDVCDACGGIWVDWHDGELQQIAKRSDSLPPPTKPSGVVPQATCPICKSKLQHEERGAAFVLRCHDCVGAFVPHDMLLPLTADTDAPESDELLLDRVVRYLFGWLFEN